MADKNIVVYSSDDCAPCKRVKAWLDSKGLTYEVKDLMAAAQAGYRSVPVIKINDKVIIGYNEAAMYNFIYKEEEEQTND